MAEPQSISSLFSDVLGPTDFAATQLEADRKLGEQLQKGSAATLFAPERARRLSKSIGGLVGADTRSPAEIKAEQTKKMVGGFMQQAASQYPDSRAAQLKAVAQQLAANGMPAEAAKFSDAAQAAELQEAKIDAEVAQAESRRATAGAQTALGGKYGAETETEVATRQGEVDKLAAQIAKENALAAQSGSAKLKTEAEIVTEIMMRYPKLDKVKAETAASNALADQRTSETQIAEAKAPLEIIKLNSEISKNNADYEKITQQLTTIGKTEFDLLLENSDYSKEKKNELRNMRLEALARTGSTAGFDIKGRAEEYAFGTYTDVINAGKEAQRPLEIFQSFLGAVEDGAATGPLADIERWSNSLGAMLNIDSSVAKAAADNLVQVLQGNITLAEASALKGALSDKDLAFLQQSLPSYIQSEQGLKDVLAYLASSKAAEIYAGQQFAERMDSDFSGKTAIESLNAQKALQSVGRYNYLVRQRALGKYKGRIPIPTASEIAQWAKFTKQEKGTAEALIEAIKLREEGA